MNRADQITTLIDDFVLCDRRIADHTSLRVSVFLADGEILRCVATSGHARVTLPDLRLKELGGNRIVNAASHDIPYSIRTPAGRGPFSSSLLLEGVGDDATGVLIAYPVVGSDKLTSVLGLAGQTMLRFTDTDFRRVHMLSALVGYELYHLQGGETRPSQLSEDIGRVLRSAREELRLTQYDLAALAGTSRIALSRWEAGAQPPSRGPLRRWATGLGLLAGGRAEIIKVVDATPQLLELLRHDPGQLSQLSPEQFELLVAERLDRMGYAVQRTGATTLKDGGIDMIAVPKIANVASFLLAVQVKHHSGGRPTRRDAVDRLLAWQNMAFRLGMLVTNTRFTRDALWAASLDPARHFLRLRDFADLTRWLYGVFASDLDWREIPNSVELAPGVWVQVPKPQFKEAGIVWPIRNALKPNI